MCVRVGRQSHEALHSWRAVSRVWKPSDCSVLHQLPNSPSALVALFAFNRRPTRHTHIHRWSIIGRSNDLSCGSRSKVVCSFLECLRFIEFKTYSSDESVLPGTEVRCLCFHIWLISNTCTALILLSALMMLQHFDIRVRVCCQNTCYPAVCPAGIQLGLPWCCW